MKYTKAVFELMKRQIGSEENAVGGLVKLHSFLSEGVGGLVKFHSDDYNVILIFDDGRFVNYRAYYNVGVVIEFDDTFPDLYVLMRAGLISSDEVEKALYAHA